MNAEYIKEIINSRVYDVAVETPLQAAPKLSARLGHQVFFKREDMQPIFSFKLRGAYNKMAHLTEAEKARGVITASAGNHAQGVAYSAQKLGVRAVIVMPATTPHIKVQAVKSWGAEVVLFGDSYSDAATEAYRLQALEGFTFVHPFDDPLVIAGQGTVGLELVRQVAAAPDQRFTIFVPIGGGGLIAGLAVFFKSINPNVTIVGVEPDDSNAMRQSIDAGERIILDKVGIFVDGVAVRQVGEHTFNLVRQYVDEFIEVSTDDVCSAIKDIFDDTRSIQEPAGALAVAGLKRYVQQKNSQGDKVDDILVALTCGANINFDRLRHVAERANVGNASEAVMAVTIPEQAGAFKAFCRTLGARSITEFNYRYADHQQAHIFVGVQVDHPEQSQSLVNILNAEGYPTLDLSHNDLAVVHVRHMVGGRAPQIQNERLYTFIFPERPGALMHFLEALQANWNISLFHYRNHGSAYGRVLAGIQVDDADLPEFEHSLQTLGYSYVEETHNVAYQKFLQ